MPDTSPAGRVLLVEAHKTLARLLRETLAAMPGLVVAAEVSTAQDALAAAAVNALDLVILDLHLPDAFGLEVVSSLQAAGCRAKVIVLIEEDDVRYHQAAWQRGAAACVEKEHVAGGLARAVHQVLAS